MSGSERLPARVGFWAVLILGLFAWAPALYPGYWQAWEGFAPVFQSVHPTAIASVATIPELWRGTGSGAFLIAQPLLRLGVEPALAIRITFILTFILGGAAIYAWLADRLGDRGAGLAGLAYMLLPMTLATVYTRGSVSDALMLALTPLALAGLASYSHRRSMVGAAVAVLSILWMWRVQAGMSLAVALMLLLYVLIVEHQLFAALIVVASAAAGLASLIPLWAAPSPPSAVFSAQFAQFFTMLDTGSGFGPGRASSLDRYPFQFGFAVLVGSILAAWGALVRREQLSLTVRRLVWFSLGAVAAAILLSSNGSDVLWQATHADRLLSYPWQLLLVVAPLMVAPLGALPLILPELDTPVYWSVLVAMVVIASLAHLMPRYTQANIPPRPIAILGDEQLVILDTRLTEQTDPRSATMTITWQPLQPLDFDYNIFFQALVKDESADGGEAVVAQLDAQPLGDAQPPTSWQPGEVLTTTYTLDLSAAPPDAKLTYYFGYYDWRNGARLAVDGGRDDKLVLHGK